MKKVNEIFYSLQGEGFHTGTPAIFVRFSGCNLKCSFCDTAHQEGIEMSDEQIQTEILKYPARMVIFTGGEPGLWVDDALIHLIHQAGKYVAIETNGTQLLPEGIDWVTCSPKPYGELKISRIDELKVVFQGQDMAPFEKIPARHYFLQPCSGQNTAQVVSYLLEHPHWRLSLQTHKLIDIQ